MDDFNFRNPTRILFGRSAERQVGTEARKHGTRVLLHFGGQSIRRSGLLDRVKASLAQAGITAVELGGVQPNPRLALVQEGIRLCREHRLELILAVGGGSVIDSAKAIAAGVPYAGDVWDFFSGKAVPASALPVATVLTIPAAGSEASTGTVITKEEGQLKRAFNSEWVYPVFSILNPELAFTLPPFQVACGAADIMAHLMERYFTNSRPVELTDRLLEGTMKNLIGNAPKVLAEPTNYDAWAEMMWTGCVAHNNLLNTGREGDWASHDIEHELSGIYDVAHGAGLAVVFPAWLKHVLHQDVARFAQWAVRVWGVEQDFFDAEATAREGIRRLTAFFGSLGLAHSLSGLGIHDDRLAEMAQKCSRGGTATVGHFVELDEAGILAVLKGIPK